ncbi:MAG: hypothetical protein J7619_01010 [Dyadobacter sp.]|uniref:hypothetical protein n=1 Tax=Dyadobacter sp. TaxID=1914288 RepID=UPI001AFD0008|nr:hypothetical protein [Dyadobacter sp.]MBO9611237.1 hypothetical protein [Dyadobacter sp.]
MENEDAFRKVKDKLAGFEAGFRDDSWSLFEQHRLKKERRRRLVGALRVGALVLFLAGILTGSWFFLESGGKHARSGQRRAAISKPVERAAIAVTDKPSGRHPHGNVVRGRTHSTTTAPESTATTYKASFKAKQKIPVISGLSPSHGNPSIAPVHGAPVWPYMARELPNMGPSVYEVSLELPAIQQSEQHIAGRRQRGFQLSLGPAVRANYARPSESRLTLGPAIFGTFPMTSRFSLRGGLALMREHVYVSNRNPVFSKDAVKWLNRGDYHWWELEIPVDIQVRLYQNPRYSLSGLFGVSSSLFWGEHFREMYQKGKIVTTTLALHDGEVREVEGLASTQDMPLTSGSTGAVFAPVTHFNASILWEKKITPNRAIMVEPQVRYPVGGITSRNLKFTSIGLQIRISY